MKNIFIYSIRVVLFLILIMVILIIPSCGEKKEDFKKQITSIKDTLQLDLETKKMFGKDLKTLLIGNFDKDTALEAIAGLEFTENNNWGIKFVLLEIENNQLSIKYQTNLLEGSFKESLVKKITLPHHNYEMVYYDSEDYFWGSGGGEVFSYIIDFNDQSTYYAHLFSEGRKHVELYLSENIRDKDLRNYFVTNFMKDYPDLRIAAEDVSLEF